MLTVELNKTELDMMSEACDAQSSAYWAIRDLSGDIDIVNIVDKKVEFIRSLKLKFLETLKDSKNKYFIPLSDAEVEAALVALHAKMRECGNNRLLLVDKKVLQLLQDRMKAAGELYAKLRMSFERRHPTDDKCVRVRS